MQIDLTPEQDDIVRHAIAIGRITRPEDAVSQAMNDWVERERERADFIASIKEADAACERGEGLLVETIEQHRTLIASLKARLRAEARKSGRSARR